MLYDENGKPIMHKDLPTPERIEQCYNNIFKIVIDTQAYVYEIRKAVIFIVIVGFIEVVSLVFLMSLMLKLI